MPAAQWRRLKEALAGKQAADGEKGRASLPPENQAVQEVEPEEEEKITGSDEHVYEDVINLLPKSYKGRAKVLLHYLKPRLDKSARIIYDGGKIGSHILDLIRFVLNPLKSRSPPDRDDFLTLLKQSGMPQSIYHAQLANDIFRNDSAVSKNSYWLTLD